MMDMTEKWKKQDQLAREVLTLSRNTLLVKLRFLDMALSCLDWVPIENSTRKFAVPGGTMKINLPSSSVIWRSRWT